MAKKPAKTDKAPKPVSAESDGEKERLTDLDHTDELGDMVDRLYGVTAAIHDAFNDGPNVTPFASVHHFILRLVLLCLMRQATRKVRQGRGNPIALYPDFVF
jgi:hypothetical protein